MNSEAVQANKFDAVNLARWCAGRWTEAMPAGISQIVHDSRSVTSGSLYVAIRGERLDGHQFVQAALEGGAAAALVDEQGARALAPHLPLLVVDDTRVALLQLASAYRKTLRGTVIAVSGSAGKTTVKELIAGMLQRVGPVCKTQGNWNNDLGLPLSMLAMDKDDAFGVFEIGVNHPGEMAPLAAALQPDLAVLTNVGPAHIEFFESEEHIAQEKVLVFQELPGDGLAICNRDDAWFDCARNAAGMCMVSVSLNPASNAALHGTLLPGGTLQIEFSSGHVVTSRLPQPGRHFAMDVLQAVAVADALGVPTAAMVDAVAAYQPPEMRWQLQEAGDVLFVNDAYNANPLSMRASLAAFAELEQPGRKWIVLGGMHELGDTAQAAHRQLGQLAGGGDWAGLIAVGELAAWIAEGAEETGVAFAPIFRCSDAVQAASVLRDAELRAGDAVLLKASRCEHLEKVLDQYGAFSIDERAKG